jgi:hypothetical protein
MKELWDNEEDKAWNMLKPGEVILATVQFTDTDEVKVRPALLECF